MVNPKIATCRRCNLKHRHVEASGILHCPNPLCPGSGGGWFRSKLDSYCQLPCGRHTVDEKEYQEKGEEYLMEHPDCTPPHLVQKLWN